jgi:hypothetical protein
MSFSDRELYEPIGGYPDEKQERLFGDRTEKSKPNAGAVREALGMPYTRQIPLEAIAAAAASLEYGAKKYADRNWEKGLPWQQMIDSLKRHVEDFERGHDYDDGDDGSDLHQVCMIMASAMMLCASVVRGIGVDDRMQKVGEKAYTAKQCAKFIEDQLRNARPVKGK